MDMTDVIIDKIINDEKKMARIANISGMHNQIRQAKNYICALSREYKVKMTKDQVELVAWKVFEEVWYGRKAE